MEYRFLGRSGFQVPELCFGTGTFGGANEFFIYMYRNDDGDNEPPEWYRDGKYGKW